MIDLDSIKRVITLHDDLKFDFGAPGLRCSCGELLVVPRTWKPDYVPKADWDEMDEQEKEEAREGARGDESMRAANASWLTHRAKAISSLVES